MSPPPPPAYAPVTAVSPESGPGAAARPPGVTYACVLSIVLGCLGAMAGLFVLAFSAAFAAFPVVGLFGVFFAFFGILFLAMAAVGIVAGVQGLKGADWARWTMVVLFGVGALVGLSTLVVPALNIVAIVMLVNAQATAWFQPGAVRRA